jgi:hypothetical protein
MITKLSQLEHDRMYLLCIHIEYVLVHDLIRWDLTWPQSISPTNQSCATSKGASSCAGATRAALAERGRREPCRGRAVATSRAMAGPGGARRWGAPRRAGRPCCGRRTGLPRRQATPSRRVGWPRRVAAQAGRVGPPRAGRASLGAPRAGTRRAAAPIRVSALPGAGRGRRSGKRERARGSRATPGGAPRPRAWHARPPWPRAGAAPGERARPGVGLRRDRGWGRRGGARPPWPRAEAAPRRAPGQRRAPRTRGEGGNREEGSEGGLTAGQGRRGERFRGTGTAPGRLRALGRRGGALGDVRERREEAGARGPTRQWRRR